MTWINGAIVAVAVLTLVGLVAFWPRGDAPDLGLGHLRYVDATITSVTTSQCRSIEVPDAFSGCREVGVRLTSGDRDGEPATFTVYDTQFEVPDLHEDDDVVLLDSPSSPDSNSERPTARRSRCRSSFARVGSRTVDRLDAMPREMNCRIHHTP